VVESGVAQSAADRGWEGTDRRAAILTRTEHVRSTGDGKSRGLDLGQSALPLPSVCGERGTDYKFLFFCRTGGFASISSVPTGTRFLKAPDLEFKAVARDLFGVETTADFEWIGGRPAQDRRNESPRRT